MAENTGEILHVWCRPEFAREVKELADRDGRSVSNLIKVALRDRLSEDTSQGTAKAERPSGALPLVPPARGVAPALEGDDG